MELNWIENMDKGLDMVVKKPIRDKTKYYIYYFLTGRGNLPQFSGIIIYLIGGYYD